MLTGPMRAHRCLSQSTLLQSQHKLPAPAAILAHLACHKNLSPNPPLSAQLAQSSSHEAHLDTSLIQNQPPTIFRVKFQGPDSAEHGSCPPLWLHYSPAFDFSHFWFSKLPRTTHFSSDAELKRRSLLPCETDRKRAGQNAG